MNSNAQTFDVRWRDPLYKFAERIVRLNFVFKQSDFMLHTAWIRIWMVKRPSTTSRHAKNVFDPKKIFFEIEWALFEIILFIHFYPPKKAHGQSQKHFMNKLHKILLFTTSVEYIWTKKYSDFHAWVEKCHFGNFSERLIWYLHINPCINNQKFFG